MHCFKAAENNSHSSRCLKLCFGKLCAGGTAESAAPCTDVVSDAGVGFPWPPPLESDS